MTHCFEFAAYRPHISAALYASAWRHVATAQGVLDTPLAALTRREPAEVRGDTTGYLESQLFTSFTQVIECVDENDERDLADLLESVHLTRAPVVEFEYHGRLHYGWATCVLTPRHPTGDSAEPPDQQILRMSACLEIAHSFLGACAAFDRLFRSEIQTQVGGYVGATTAGHEPRGPDDLNRLRTLALAIVNLTNFDLVTDTAEDREYFRLFAQDSQVRTLQRSIQETCEVLYNVQTAERERRAGRRQDALNLIALLLASFAMLSVLADVYDYLGGQQPLVADRFRRGELLAEVLVGLALVVAACMLLLSLPGRPGRRGRRS